MKRLFAVCMAFCLVWCMPAFAALSPDAQTAYQNELADQESQTCELLKDKVKTTDPDLTQLAAVTGVTFAGQTETEILSADDTGLYYVYASAANKDKKKEYNLLTCLYRHEGEYLVQSGEFDTLLYQALDFARENGGKTNRLLVCKDAAFLVVETDNGVLYYPTTQRAYKISKTACDYSAVQEAFAKLQDTDTGGFFSGDNLKGLGLSIILIGMGLFFWEFLKARQRKRGL